MRVFKTRTRVRYAETDASGITYYASYLLYCEVGRVQMFRELGLPYDAKLPIVETYCRYHASARFDELLEVQTFVEEVRRCGFRLGARIFRVDETGGEALLLAEGYCAMVHVGDDRKPAPLPDAFTRAFAATP